MAQYDRIQPITGAQADGALDRALDRFDAQELRSELDAHNFVDKCRKGWETDSRKDRVENLTTEGLELAMAPTAGALAAWRTKGGFPIGQLANFVVGAGAKAVSIGMVAKLPDFDEANDAPAGPRRFVRSLARAGKVLLHSQMSMTTRDAIEDDQ
jgi:hypothetical protein